MTHHLKCLSQQWPYYKSGLKTGSLRKNDRQFAVGDICILQLWDNDHFVLNEMAVKKISHIVHDYEFKELPDGYCLLSFKEV